MTIPAEEQQRIQEAAEAFVAANPPPPLAPEQQDRIAAVFREDRDIPRKSPPQEAA